MINLYGLMRGKCNRCKETRKEKIASCTLVNQHGVLTKPAKTGTGSKLSFCQRRRIDNTSGFTTRYRVFQPPAKVIQT
jgi:hypothetical protein